eukprot:CFRG0925T1
MLSPQVLKRPEPIEGHLSTNSKRPRHIDNQVPVDQYSFQNTLSPPRIVMDDQNHVCSSSLPCLTCMNKAVPELDQ